MAVDGVSAPQAQKVDRPPPPPPPAAEKEEEIEEKSASDERGQHLDVSA